jgi:uncharacterized phiE125 gp8 family phage protein
MVGEDSGIAGAAVTLSEAQAWARVETGQEEALLAGLVRTASALCEAFTGQVLIARDFTVEVAASAAWQRLPLTPVRSIDAVEAVGIDGSATALPSGAYALDIDARGDGWVRLSGLATSGRLRVRGRAGSASDVNGVPEPLRQGILRLVAHLHAHRDGPAGEPPAAVTALWRPYRRVRL